MAQGIEYAASCGQLVARDSSLRRALAENPIHLARTTSGKIVAADSSAQPDSMVLARFQRLNRTASGSLYTIRLETLESKQGAINALPRWRSMETAAARDSNLSVVWDISGCDGDWTVGLFILPPGLSPSGRYDVCFLLLIDERDAARLAHLIDQRTFHYTEVKRIRVTEGVIRSALAAVR